jgi:hypothetical protein
MSDFDLLIAKYSSTLQELSDGQSAKLQVDSKGRLLSKISNDAENPLLVSTAGVDWDEIVTTYPDTTSDLFTYKKNNISVQTVLVTYEDSTKSKIIGLRKTRF